MLQKRALRLMHYLAIIQLTRFHIFCPVIFFPKHALFQISCYSHARYHNLAPQNIFLFVSTLPVKFTLITIDPRQQVIKKWNFQHWINKVNHFQDWRPKYGIEYLRVLEISQNQALKRKHITAYFKSFHKQTTTLIYKPY